MFTHYFVLVSNYYIFALVKEQWLRNREAYVLNIYICIVLHNVILFDLYTMDYHKEIVHSLHLKIENKYIHGNPTKKVTREIVSLRAYVIYGMLYGGTFSRKGSGEGVF